MMPRSLSHQEAAAAEKALAEEMKTPAPPFDPFDGKPPCAQVTQVGRWTYRVVILHGMMSWGPDGYGWHRLGRRWAERKAVRALAAYSRYEKRQASCWTIGSADGA